MAKSKHSKVKNTGILFELLARQLTADTLNDVQQPAAIAIIREFFVKNTALKKELQLYQSLVKQKFDSEPKAAQFIDAVLNERRKITNKTLANQKYNLIKEIKKHYDLEKFVASPVIKYKEYASAYRLFESLSDREINDPKVIMQCRISLTESITTKRAKDEQVKRTMIEQFASQDEDTRLLAYKILIDKFNSKYKGLTKDQKNLLEQYINNVSNKKTLAEFINKKAASLHTTLVSEKKKIKDKVVSIKLNEVIKHLKPLTEIKSIKDKHILNMMRYYDLKTELKHVSTRQTRQVI
tara:strand:- start:457 stop:1344 length:888 start_codon:yes stop_codon:yes gene_type:complete